MVRLRFEGPQMGAFEGAKPTVSLAAVTAGPELPVIRSAWSFFSASSWMAASAPPASARL